MKYDSPMLTTLVIYTLSRPLLILLLYQHPYVGSNRVSQLLEIQLEIGQDIIYLFLQMERPWLLDRLGIIPSQVMSDLVT